MTASDLNNDGLNDVLTASYNDDTIAWFPNKGTVGAAAFGLSVGTEPGLRNVLCDTCVHAVDVHAVDIDQDNGKQSIYFLHFFYFSYDLFNL